MNRKRPNTVAFRLSNDEKQILLDRIKKSGMTSQDFLLRSAIEKPIMNTEVFQSLLIELRKQGTNLNQLARACNSGHQEEVAESVIALSKKITKLVQALRVFYEMDSRGIDLSKLKNACEESSLDETEQNKKILEELKAVWQFLKL